MPLSPQFFSPCLQISKSSPNLRKPSFLWTAACTATWLNPNKSKAMTTALMWSSPEARTESCCGCWGRGCQPQTRCTGVVPRLRRWQSTKEILIPYKFCSVQVGPVYILQANHLWLNSVPKKTTFLLVGGGGGQTHLLIFPLAAGAVGNCGVHVGVGFFSISFELLMQILALFSM